MAAKLSGSGGSKFDLGQNADINVTPFVDVMLVLLIIFMVAAPMATVSIKLDMPPPPTEFIPPDKEPVLVNVEQYGKLYIGDQETNLTTLIADVETALASANPTDEQLLIRANRYVAYKDFMGVLNLLQFNGYLKIALVAEDL